MTICLPNRALFCAFLLSLSTVFFVSCKKSDQKTSDTSKSSWLTAVQKSASFKTFAGDDHIVLHKTEELPESGFKVVYVAAERSDADMEGAVDRADMWKGHLFFVNKESKKVDAALTQKVNSELAWDAYSATEKCGGLASLDTAAFKVSGKALMIEQFYAPAREHHNCRSKLIWEAGTVKITDAETEETGPDK